ncbi:MAG: hypothetical protein EP348_07725 [Alphaproteobacteria bacterium]|nr:MAG: hypothetical protein EP348_07725 [Alphaproteobacteria bacterium]
MTALASDPDPNITRLDDFSRDVKARFLGEVMAGQAAITAHSDRFKKRFLAHLRIAPPPSEETTRTEVLLPSPTPIKVRRPIRQRKGAKSNCRPIRAIKPRVRGTPVKAAPPMLLPEAPTLTSRAPKPRPQKKAKHQPFWTRVKEKLFDLTPRFEDAPGDDHTQK